MISEEKKAYNRQYHQSNKDKLNQYNREWYKRNRERVRKESKEKYQNNKEAILESQKEYSSRPEAKTKARERKLSKIGWTSEMYDEKHREQKGLCAICKNPNAPVNNKGECLAADHEHTNPPTPRGLLCTRCNTGLGQFLDNPMLLAEAMAYLAKYALKMKAHA